LRRTLALTLILLSPEERQKFRALLDTQRLFSSAAKGGSLS
jgi:hypothetical protein